ncbi:MAG: lytic transglycosylase domain-containing protein [Beijerinckiaceae bacterium]|nr:lytic transglycosylase domain-containing protein [Beijerinckiaceae bacterium]
MLACLLTGANALAQEYPVVFETGPQPAVKAKRGATGPSAQLGALIAQHASANGVPHDLAHRIIMRESRYNPSARNRSYYGLMQISHATARGVGYSGAPQGLLDPNTNLRYGMAYLGNAYRVAGGDQKRAAKLYSSGYYHVAKRNGTLSQTRRAAETPQIATR